MTTKTLTITEDAYERLVQCKGRHESFSDVIVKYFPKRSLMELVGILTDAEAESLREHIRAKRRLSRRRIDQIAQAL